MKFWMYKCCILRYNTFNGLMAQLVRAPPCHGGGRGFESRLGRYGSLAQLGEHLPYKQRVTGSSPVTSISYADVAHFSTIDEKRVNCRQSSWLQISWWYMPMWLNWQSSWFVISRLSVRVRSSAFTIQVIEEWSRSILYCFVINGQIPEWPKGTDCKSAATCFGGSNPPLPILLFRR